MRRHATTLSVTFVGLTVGALLWAIMSGGASVTGDGAKGARGGDREEAMNPDDPPLEHLAGLSYLAVVSGDAAPDATLPMVIALHGVANRVRMPGLPYFGVEHGLRLVRPQAPEPYEDGFTWLPVRFHEAAPADLARSVRQRADELAVLVERLVERYPTRGKPIMLGFSQGGTLTFGLAVRHPDLLSAAFPLAPSVPPPLLDDVRAPGDAGPRIRMLHSRDDPIAAIDSARRAVRHLQGRGFDVALHEVDGAEHQLSPEMSRVVRRWLTEAVFAQNRAR